MSNEEQQETLDIELLRSWLKMLHGLGPRWASKSKNCVSISKKLKEGQELTHPEWFYVLLAGRWFLSSGLAHQPERTEAQIRLLESKSDLFSID